MTLRELVEFINKEYKQESILLPTYFRTSGHYFNGSQPKYLFRGENDFFKETKSNYQRLIEKKLFDDSELSEVKKIIIELSVELTFKILGFVGKDDPRYQANILEMMSFMQHYGFPVLFIDFTSDIEIAAKFAEMNNKNKSGRICVLSTHDVINNDIVEKRESIFDLTNSRALRPKIQKAYELRAYDDTDLKNKNDNYYSSIKWFDFELTPDDLKYHQKSDLLNTNNDDVAKAIKKFLEGCNFINQKVGNYFFDISKSLQPIN